MDVKCLDTYALVEIKLGNKKFIPYFNSSFVITDITLVEFYSVLLREENEQTAEYWFKKLENHSVPIDRSLLREAVRFRHENKKTGISFFDAVGYVYALKKGFRFVTGDKEFKTLKGVEFLKK